MNNILDLIKNLLPLAAPFVPAAGGTIPELVEILVKLLAYIRKESGMTTDEILDRAGATLDENEKMLLEDKMQSQGGTP